jgi:hypothetical protein
MIIPAASVAASAGGSRQDKEPEEPKYQDNSDPKFVSIAGIFIAGMIVGIIIGIGIAIDFNTRKTGISQSIKDDAPHDVNLKVR